MSLKNRFLSYFENYFMGGRKRFNLIKTLYLNFVCLPFNQAIKLPIYCYGSMRFPLLRGRIIILGEFKTGCVKIGVDITKYRTRGVTTLTLLPDSIFYVGCHTLIYQGASILVGKNAVLEMKEFSTLGDDAEIICKRKITIGKHSDITWQCQVTDFNSHFILDIDTGRVSTIFKEVQIGDYCWIGNRTTIQPGTILPTRVIVCSNTLLNKDYTKRGLMPNSLIGGIPAKILKTDICRIYDITMEIKLLEIFSNSDNDVLLDKNIV